MVIRAWKSFRGASVASTKSRIWAGSRDVRNNRETAAERSIYSIIGALMNGKLIVVTAPLTETIDHAGFFIQMGMASMPVWMQWVMDKKYPHWKDVEYNPDGSARVYTSIFGSSKRPINSHYSRLMFEKIKRSPYRGNFKVVVGGSGGWQIIQTDTFDELGVDCVIEGRSESQDTMEIFHKAIRGEAIPRTIEVKHPTTRGEILYSDKRTTFGVVEMTTGCGRRCQFCLPDLNPQIDLPKENILAATRANVRGGNKLISLATEDMFIWGQVQTETPFFFPNREALLDLYSSIVNEPGVEQHVLSHATIAPFVTDPMLIEKLSDVLLPKSPLHLPAVSTHPLKKALCPLIGLETG